MKGKECYKVHFYSVPYHMVVVFSFYYKMISMVTKILFGNKINQMYAKFE